MHVLVQSLEKFAMQLVSFVQVHDLWHEFNACDVLYACEVCSDVIYFIREQLYVTCKRACM